MISKYMISDVCEFAVVLHYTEGKNAAVLIDRGEPKYLLLKHSAKFSFNPELAEIIYKTCSVGQEIPNSLYEDVATAILSAVFL